MRLPLLLIAYLLAEIAAFAWVGEKVGVLGTVALVVLSTIIGLWLVQRQGLDTLRKVAGLGPGQAPVVEAWDGLCLATAGVLFAVPGFLSDLAGVALLIPPVRRALLGQAQRLSGTRFTVRTSSTGSTGFGPNGSSTPARPTTVIDGDFVDVTKPDDAPHLPKE
ncbi:FxsA family protein [Nitrospirillum sp. BR 11828]|uniref:FxsA family protein n=1 Tax=Nitrospirillum sp. BR 11828 TaxID=3104325 RepID=UPI002ACABE21|nr:FxsA family protein [Nitrospirillum sp. BR 11828]MDZ5647015.1 FxsA family protein [Nitrospirillum sp. BR 11828]